MAGSAVPSNYGATGPLPSTQHLDPPGAPVSKSRSCGALNFAPPGSAYPHLAANSHKDSKSTEASPPPPYTAVTSHPVKQAPQSRAAPPMETTITPWQPGPGDRTQYEGPDMPSADLPESHMGTEPVPLPPEVGRLPKIRGYEGTSHHASGSGPPIPPPPYNGSKENTKRPEEQYSSVSQISADQARKALLKEVSKHCCYGKGAVSGMEITQVSRSNAMHYKLETFTESRGVSWEQEPFRGQAIDKASDGAAPSPWSVHCQPTNMFNNEVHAMEVPHTAVVMPCHGCSSMGWLRCHNCQGRGYKRCLSCNGSGRDWKVDAHGHRHVESCWQCHGTGRKRCLSCNNDGRIVCKTCQGFRQVKCYIKLTVTFKNHAAEHVVEKSDVPVNLVKGVTGILVFEQSLPRVWPIAHYPDQEVCSGSQKLVDEHNNKYKNARILMQRQKLRSVPVSECSYKWKSTEDHFWVYGKEEAVYVPNYPQKCCWGCTIL